MFARTVTSPILTLLLLVNAFGQSPSKYYYRLPGTATALAVYPSPVSAIVVIVTTSEQEDETGGAVASVLDLSSPKKPLFAGIEVSEGGSDPAWKSDGSGVLIATPGGIVELDPADVTHGRRILATGDVYGVALSEDEHKLAYWDWPGQSMQVVARSLQPARILRRWSLEFRYGSEPYGFQMAFADNDAFLARTFDKLSGTPLKRFDIVSGKVDIVERDCLSLAYDSEAIYFIATSAHGTLLKKVIKDKIETVSSITGFDTVRRSAMPGRLVLTGKRKSAILDTSSDQLSASSSCDFMTVLSDGSLLYVHGATLSSDEAICGHSSPSKVRR